jgi:hypothetical protein
LFPKWKVALEHLIQAKERLSVADTIADRKLRELDYEKARAAYDKITDEI